MDPLHPRAPNQLRIKLVGPVTKKHIMKLALKVMDKHLVKGELIFLFIAWARRFGLVSVSLSLFAIVEGKY